MVVTKLEKTTRFTRLYCNCEDARCGHAHAVCMQPAKYVADGVKMGDYVVDGVQLCSDCLRFLRRIKGDCENRQHNELHVQSDTCTGWRAR